MIKGLFITLLRQLGSLVLAFLGALWGMLRPGLRFLSAIALLVATIALVADVTRLQLGGEGPLFMPLAQHFRDIMPGTLVGLEAGVKATFGSFMWSPVITSMMSLPAWLAFAALGAATLYAVRDKPLVNVFIN